MNLQFESEEPKKILLQALPEAQTAQPQSVAMLNAISETERAQMQRIAQKLRRKNPVGQIAKRFFLGFEIEEMEIAVLLKRLGNNSANRWRERTFATWLLGVLPLSEDHSGQAVKTLGRIVETSHKQDRVRTWGRFCYRSVLYFLTVALFFFGLAEFRRVLAPSLMSFWIWLNTVLDPYLTLWELSHPGPDADTIAMVFVLAMLFIVIPAPITLPLSLYIDRRNQLRVRKVAVKSLERLGSVRALPSLLATIRGANGEFFENIVSCVASLLPKLTPEHYGTLRADVTPNLCYILETFKGNFNHEILNAIEKVGDSRAIPTLKRIIQTDLAPNLRERATEILPILEARQILETHSNQLLRPSQDPIAHEQLLRPARDTEDKDEKTLLRPSDS